MMHRPQRTEDAQRLEARTARTFAAPLRAGVSSNNCPARSRRKPPWAEARARGVPLPLSSQPPHGERACSGTGRAAQQCTRRACDAYVAEQELSALAERVRVGASVSRWLGPPSAAACAAAGSAASNREVCEAMSDQK